MSENKKITRRDAIKLLGVVTGATVLANLPSKWSTPQIARGVLPAHAQTSTCIAFSHIVIASDPGSDWSGNIVQGPGPDIFGPNGYNAWSCVNDCLIIYNSLAFGTSVTIEYTTLTGQFTLTYVANTEHYILVNLATGEYAIDFVGSAGDCTWPNNQSIAPLQGKSYKGN